LVEQSVDIDLDFIVSDLAPTDMLLQRVGRLWRHERPHRPATAPEFWIRLPELSATFNAPELKTALGRSARVYAPYVLLRTAAVLSGRKELALPADIRGLLETTYAEPDAQEPEAWQELHATLEEEKAALAANPEAATLVLGRPGLCERRAGWFRPTPRSHAGSDCMGRQALLSLSCAKMAAVYSVMKLPP
jgi:hypothetical protein